ncbi:hypothetical protein R75461_08439 [Paraburkholderia nemoris]|uniref:hypothetical protein n=1 Tax=Paraburkholderia nemoris TaxID=2793076 RepID=UPI001B16D372|nr:hypothetical protein [Paraburkholderia nemoris]CAE6868605.1 hypothetical protein R75461_08439 [Paraburkholderia nemoris]
MKAKARGTGWRTHTLLAMTAMSCGLHSAGAATGGTIYFTGMIVAPALEVSSVVLPPASSVRVTTQAGASASTVAVTFRVPSGGVPGVDVSWQVNGATASQSGAAAPDMPAARFADGRGHVVAPAPDGRYHVGSNGATLLLGAKSGDPLSAGRALTVVLSYD